MELPVIEAYAMPVGTALPAPRVPWKPAPSRAALLAHRMQNHSVRPFPAGRAPVVELVRDPAALRAPAPGQEQHQV
ncbi:hypothetical protein [Streptomyces physcomitrii]|uniref:Uncharacterized protein n=1 Tax=Streptomyces physcomitrii TaxID=2724184 RepID=A0ABX1H262_9ACTN|nr:hypothetical protein [Streptomyces physcomitrii]NKI42456.1 hypothetical protein [Streptomyces physcomitrii]